MEDEYDVVVLGTGLKECILSGLMSSVAKKKVLHLDRNNYYGGESASLNMEQLYQKFRDGAKPDEEKLGRSRKYCVDLCPKFIMSTGRLVDILIKTGVKDYLEFKVVAGSYVYKDGKIHKVPSTASEALASKLMGMFQKRRFKSFLGFCVKWEEGKESTWDKCPPKTMTAKDLYAYWKLEPATIQFVGHAMAMYLNDDYLNEPYLDLMLRVKLSLRSISRYQDAGSPFIYPKWGLGGLPEGFSRRCAVFGGVYMLNIEEKKPFIEKIHYDDDGKVCGVQVGGEVAKCKQVIADPSYFLEQEEKKTAKVEKTGRVARTILILKQGPPDIKGSDSAQVIIPAVSVGRKSDLYISITSHAYEISPAGTFVAVVSGTVETDNPEKELDVAVNLLGPPSNIIEKFHWVTDQYKPVDDGQADQCFVTSSYDATSHFETCTKEVLEVFERVTGEPLKFEEESEAKE